MNAKIDKDRERIGKSDLVEFSVFPSFDDYA